MIDLEWSKTEYFSKLCRHSLLQATTKKKNRLTKVLIPQIFNTNPLMKYLSITKFLST
jgi:hypothetical protein